MCDYCDCRSHPVIAALSEEHAVLLGWLDRLDRAADLDDAPAAATIAREMHGLLGEHADFEERGMFAEVRAADIDAAYVGRFEREHRQIHALLDGCGGTAWPHAAHDLASLLRAHIDREETDLFPAAHQLLTPLQWSAIDARRPTPDPTGTRP